MPGGRGAIDGGALLFTCHRVGRPDPAGLQANEGMKASPEYLRRFIAGLRDMGCTFVSLDDLATAVSSGGKTLGLVSLTFDDGYRDNLEVGLPLLESLGVPFTVFVTCAMADGTAFLWWLALEAFLKARTSVRLADGRELDCRSPGDRERTFMTIRGMVLSNADGNPRTFLLDRVEGFESAIPEGDPRRCAMSFSDVESLDRSPLVTIGSHTMSHANLGQLTEDAARRELCDSKARLERAVGKEVRHLAFPFGGRKEAGHREYRLASEAGYVTAATTLAGSVARGDSRALLRLPRIFLREGFDPGRLIAENRARAWLEGIGRIVRG